MLTEGGETNNLLDGMTTCFDIFGEGNLDTALPVGHRPSSTILAQLVPSSLTVTQPLLTPAYIRNALTDFCFLAFRSI